VVPKKGTSFLHPITTTGMTGSNKRKDSSGEKVCKKEPLSTEIDPYGGSPRESSLDEGKLETTYVETEVEMEQETPTNWENRSQDMC